MNHRLFCLIVLFFLVPGILNANALSNISCEEIKQCFIAGTLDHIPTNTHIQPCLEQPNHVSFHDTCITLFDSDKTPFKLGIGVPHSVASKKLYPLILYLHGGIGNSHNQKGEKAYDMFQFIADTIPLFLASPSASTTVPWWTESGIQRILSSIRYLSLTYPIDPNRIYCAGVSDGAVGCFALANTIPHPFAAFIAVSGFGGMLPFLGMQLYPENLKQRPFYVVHGGTDRLYPLAQVTQFFDWLHMQGVFLTRRIYPDEGHGFDYRIKERANLTSFIARARSVSSTTISWRFVNSVSNMPDNIIAWQEVSGSPLEKRIEAVFRHDTLSVEQTGLASITIVLNPSFAHKTLYVNHVASQTISPFPIQTTTSLNYPLLFYTGSPKQYHPQNIVTIRFR